MTEPCPYTCPILRAWWPTARAPIVGLLRDRPPDSTCVDAVIFFDQLSRIIESSQDQNNGALLSAIGAETVKLLDLVEAALKRDAERNAT
jgi:hypothetical protein